MKRWLPAIIPIGRQASVRVVSSLLQAALLIVIARSVSMPEFGGYAATVAIGTIAAGLFGVGMPTRSLRLAAEGLQYLTLSYCAFGLAASSLTFLTTMWISTSYIGPVQSWTIAGAIFAASEVELGIIQGILFGELRNRRAEILLVARRAIPLLFAIATMTMSPDHLFYGAAAGSCVAVVLAFVMLGPRTWSGWHVSRVLLSTTGYWLANIGSMLQQLDVTIIARAMGAFAAGAFAGAFRLANPVHVVTSALVSIYVPKLSHESDSQRRHEAGQSMMRMGLMYGLAIGLFAPLTVHIGPALLGAQYGSHAYLFPILMLNSATNVVNQLQSARLYAEGCSVQVAVATVLSTLVGLLVVAFAARQQSLYLAAMGTWSIQITLVISLAVVWRTTMKPTVPLGLKG